MRKHHLLIGLIAITTLLLFTHLRTTKTPAQRSQNLPSLPSSPLLEPNALSVGKQVSLPLINQQFIAGVINSAQEIVNGTWQYGGNLLQGDGTFALAVERDRSISGTIIIPSRQIGYVLKPTETGAPLMFEPSPITGLLCHQTPGDNNMDLEEAGALVEAGTVATTANAINIPRLASRPNSKFHVYLDFDGERVQDPLWNGGKLIEAKPPAFSEGQIREIWAIVAERYAAFNINVSTRVEDYMNADINSRTRAIFTPTNQWRRGFGGIAMIGSVRNAGRSVWSPTIPCWVFTNMLGRLRSVGECAAHEIGHTLGLLHDGQGKTAYYQGQGVWAPIMGVTYNRPVAQWSKGEYLGATNKQDDIAVILSNRNVTSAVTERTAPTLTFIDGIRAMGVICSETDVATYRTSISRSCTLKLKGSVPTYGGLNLKLELLDAKGNVLVTADSLNSLDALATVGLTPGTYTVRVHGVGEGDPRTTGYSKYGSIGTFTLTTELVD